MQNRDQSSSPSTRTPVTSAHPAEPSSLPATAFAPGFLATLRMLSRRLAAVDAAGASASTEVEATLSGPLTSEPVEIDGVRRYAVVRQDEPIAVGGEAAGLFHERGEALRAAAVFPAVAAASPYHLKDRPKRLGYPLHCHDRHVGHLCHTGATLAQERRGALLSHLHLARYLATHPYALALLLESVGPEALPILGRVLARRVEAALP